MDLERLGVGGNYHQLAAIAGDKGVVFREIGRHGHDLRVMVDEERLDHGDQGGGGAAGKEQLAALDIQTEAVGQILGHSGARLREAGRHRVAVELDGVRLVHDLVDGVVDLLGRGDAGVAKRIVIDLVRAHLGGLLQTVGKQLADNGRSGTQMIEFLIDHDVISFQIRWLRGTRRRMIRFSVQSAVRTASCGKRGRCPAQWTPAWSRRCRRG